MAVSSGGGGHSDEETRRNKGGRSRGSGNSHADVTRESTEREIIDEKNCKNLQRFPFLTDKFSFSVKSNDAW